MWVKRHRNASADWICSQTQIVKYVQEQPRRFQPLIEMDLFADVHVDVSPSTDAEPSASQDRICRQCACEILLWGLKDWWIRERKKGYLEDAIMQRKDCPNGGSCTTQKDFGSFFRLPNVFKDIDFQFTAHAKECELSYTPYFDFCLNSTLSSQSHLCSA